MLLDMSREIQQNGSLSTRTPKFRIFNRPDSYVAIAMKNFIDEICLGLLSKNNGFRALVKGTSVDLFRNWKDHLKKKKNLYTFYRLFVAIP